MRSGLVAGTLGAVGLMDRLWRADPARLVVLALHDMPSREITRDDLRAVREVAQPVDLDAVLAAHRGDAPLPPRSVLLTFDDGDPSVADHAEVLAEVGFPAVCFVVSGVIGTTEPFWWREVAALSRAGARHRGDGPENGDALVLHLKGVSDEERRAVLSELRAQIPEPVEARQLSAADLAAMESAGVEIGGHTVSHPILVACDDDRLEAEVAGCRQQLADLLGRAPRAFAYPSGRVDDRAVRAVGRAGWEVAFAWDDEVAHVPFPDPLQVSRLRCSLGSGRVRLARMISSRRRSAGRATA